MRPTATFIFLVDDLNPIEADALPTVTRYLLQGLLLLEQRGRIEKH